MTQNEYLQSFASIPPLPKNWKYVLNTANGEAWDYEQEQYVPTECYELTIEDENGYELAWQMINHVIASNRNQMLVEAANKAYHKIYSDRAIYPMVKIAVEAPK